MGQKTHLNQWNPSISNQTKPKMTFTRPKRVVFPFSFQLHQTKDFSLKQPGDRPTRRVGNRQRKLGARAPPARAGAAWRGRPAARPRLSARRPGPLSARVAGGSRARVFGASGARVGRVGREGSGRVTGWSLLGFRGLLQMNRGHDFCQWVWGKSSGENEVRSVGRPQCGWTRSISHHEMKPWETMVCWYSWYLHWGINSLQGFLGGTKWISSIHSGFRPWLKTDGFPLIEPPGKPGLAKPI